MGGTLKELSESMATELGVVRSDASSELHLVAGVSSAGALCGVRAGDREGAPPAGALWCPACVELALAAGHVFAVASANFFVNLRRQDVGRQPTRDEHPEARTDASTEASSEEDPA